MSTGPITSPDRGSVEQLHRDNGWEVENPDELLYDAMIGISAHTVTKQQLAMLLEQLAAPYVDE